MSRRKLFVIVASVIGTLGIGVAVWAYFTSIGSGSGSASVSSLSAPTNVSGTATGTTVTVSWDGVTDPGAGTFGYYVTRIPSSGPSSYACGSSPAPADLLSGTSCNDTSLSSGTYTYTVTAVYNTWTATSTPSIQVTVNASVLSSFSVVPSTFTPTVGTQFNVTITALDQFSNTYTAYAGSECVTFSGPDNSPSPSSTGPTYPSPGSCSAGSSVTFTNGVATAVPVTLFDAETTPLTVTDNPSGKTGTASLTVLPAALNSFEVPSPGTQTAGSSFNETITAVDAWDNAANGWTSVNNCVTFSGPANSPNGTAPLYPSLGGSCGAGNSGLNFDSSGQVTVAITLYDAQSTTLTVASVSSPAGETGTSGTFTVAAGSYYQLLLSTPSTQTAGSGFSETVTATDQWQNPVSTESGSQPVTWASGAGFPASSPGGTAPLYPSTLTFNTTDLGVANSQASASITLYDAQSGIALQATVATKSGTSGTFMVNAGSYYQLLLSTPSTQTAGSGFSETVTATDQWQNPVSTESGSQPVTWASGAGFPASSPGGTAPLYPSTLTFNTTDLGVANSQASASITLYDAQSGIALQATVATKSGTSGTFMVNPAVEKKLAITTQPSSSITAGGTVSVGVTVEDTYGNPITTGFTGYNDSISVALSSGSFAAGTTTVAASNGLASFSGLEITSTAGSPYMITATDATAPSISSATTSSITVNPAPESTLAITSEPSSSITAGGSVSMSVTVEDQYNNPITTGFTGSTDNISLTLNTGSFAAGTTSMAAANGLASFSGLQINTAGSYTITASDTTDVSVASATTGSITVGASSAYKLQFGQQPSNTTAGVSMSPAPTVQILDQYNNPTTSTSSITLTITTNPCGGSPSVSGGTVNAVSGTATFSSLYITQACNGYVLTATDATDGGITVASSTFNITAGSAHAISVVSGNNQSTATSAPFFSPLVALVTDTYGNPVSGVTVTFAAPTSGHSGTFASSGCTTNSPTSTCGVTTGSNGQATSSTFTANSTAGSYSVTATATGVSTPATFSLTNGSVTVSTPIYPKYMGDCGSSNGAACSTGIWWTITGTNFAPGATVSFGGTPPTSEFHVVSSTTTVVNSTTITLEVTDTGATTGAVTVTVTDPGGSTGSNTMTATGISGLSSISITGPTVVGQGASTTLTLSVGTAGCTTWTNEAVYFSNPGITPGTATCSGTSSPYTVSVPITVSASALPGPGSVTVAVNGGVYSISTNGLTVDASPLLTISPSTVPTNWSVGGTYSQTFTASGGTAPYTLGEAGALPAGMTFSAGVLSGTPTAAGTFPFTVFATDSASSQHAGAQTYTLTISTGQLVITTSAVDGSTSSTPNLDAITVERENGSGAAITTGGALTVSLSSNSSGSPTFGATQFGSTETSVSIASGASTATFWYGDTVAGTPTITASATDYLSGSQLETITTAPAGLTLTGITYSGGSGTITCGTPSSDTTTCIGTGFGTSQTFTASVEFVLGGSPDVYSTTQSSTLTLAKTAGTLSVTSLTVNAGSATSSATFTGTAASDAFTGTVKFGPYTININVT